MNLILLEPSELNADSIARLTGRRAKHVFEVHRAKPGERLAVGVRGDRLGEGEVLEVDGDLLELRVELSEPPPPKAGIDLLLALPRPKVLRRVLQAAASMGVGRLVLVNSFRVEKSYFDSPLLEPEAIREQLTLGLEQGGDTVEPQVLVRPRFKPFVEDELEAMWPAACWDRLLPHPTASAGLERVSAHPAVLAIGPEGGWIPYEVEQLTQRAFRAFSLGARILRVDVAVPFAVGQALLARAR